MSNKAIHQLVGKVMKVLDGAFPSIIDRLAKGDGGGAGTRAICSRRQGVQAPRKVGVAGRADDRGDPVAAGDCA